ncbi:MAG: IS630 family transposase ISBmu8 [Phycisphaerae bacterium]|nr:IS630 family transposase ISBmu8 [Phycisphaerae bacterium]
MRRSVEITLTAEERETLGVWARARSLPARQVLRARLVLMAAEGQRNATIADKLSIDPVTVWRWRKRFLAERLVGLERERPGRGPKPTKRRHWAQTIVRVTLDTTPPNATHWSVRTLADHLGLDKSMVQRVWKAHNLQPHRVETFKLSRDPQFIEKLIDVVGLYLRPPEHALVLCVDEKSQIQALDRTQPGLPLKRGRCGTRTHDYVRHGTTTLFAALELAEGKLIGKCFQRHRHQEWLAFLKLIDRQTPAELDLHLIADNYATHKHPKVQAWLARHPRVHMHFIPTSSAWLNLIERWFREIITKRIRHGAFHSVPALEQAIYRYIDAHNDDPKPLVWTADLADILPRIIRAHETLQTVQSS